MPDYYNPYGGSLYTGQQQGGGGTGGYSGAGTSPSGMSQDEYNKLLMQQTGLPMPVSVSDAMRQNLLAQQGGLAGQFADAAQRGYGAYGQQGQQALDYYRGLAMGQNSVSAEQLRQGLAQMYGQQRSMAAGASPRNAAMAARTAAIQMGRAGTAMSGQQALAGLQERNQAMGQYGQLLGALRGQDLSAATSGRANALAGYGAANTGPPQKSWIEEYGPAIAAGAAAVAASDRALKTDIRPGDAAANAALGSLRNPTPTYFNNPYTNGLDSFTGQIAAMPPAPALAPVAPTPDAGMPWLKRLAGGLAAGLRAMPYSDRALKTGVQSGDNKANAAIGMLQPYTYMYKDQALGAGPQVGVMAQDLQKAGLGQAVVRTPIGLAIDPGKLSGANTAMIAALGNRVAKLEGGKGARAAGPSPYERPSVDSEALSGAWSTVNRLDREAAARRAAQDPAAAAAQAELQRRRELLALQPGTLPPTPPMPTMASPAYAAYSDRSLKKGVRSGQGHADSLTSALGRRKASGY